MPERFTADPICFHATAAGGSHVVHDVGCEDASRHVMLHEAGSYVVAVADGHGDKRCTRSARGSAFAVDAAVQVLSGLQGPEGASTVASKLLETWKALVNGDVEAFPLSAEERLVLGGDGAGRMPEYLYGTTLVAALVAPWGRLVVQQGDGAFVLMGADGVYAEPVPPDERCVGNKTSSLADADAEARMRVTYVAREEGEGATCFVATDGITKSFADDEDLFDFLDWVQLASQGVPPALFGPWLQGEFEQLAGDGAGDDLSLAGVIHPLSSELLRRIVSRRKRHELQELMAEARSRLVSLERRRNRLEELWNAGRKDEARDYPRVQELYTKLQEQIKDCESQLSAL